MKRQIDMNQYSNNKMMKLKKIINQKTLTLIEDLANEIFLEIFEYLDGCDIFKGFFNLNCRFYNLLNSSAFLFNIKLCLQINSSIKDYCNYNITQNKHHIISLEIINYQPEDLIFKLFNIDTSFTHLETLILRDNSSDKLESILNRLYVLPRLFSLIIYHNHQTKDFTYIYSTIFSLSFLKYCRICLDSRMSITLPIASMNQATSAIKDFIIRQSLTVDELLNLISYTPQLHRLVCKQLLKSEKYINKNISIIFSNLTHISIDYCYITFDNFEIFIKKISSQLQVLHITTIEDHTYLDADRWEYIISTFMPHLHTFYFQYKESINNNLQVTPYHKLINHFQSSFWIERNWLLEIKIDQYKRSDSLLIYSINPSKKSNEFFIHSTSKTIQFILMNISFIKSINFFLDIISPILMLIQINCLIIKCDISINILFQIISRLPYLTSLILSSLSSSEIDFKLINQEKIDNNIKKIYFKNLNTFEQIESILKLCPLIEYLQILNINHIDLQILFQLIFLTKSKQNISHYFTLCLINNQNDNNIIQQCQKINQMKDKDDNYTIIYTYDNIYLQFK